VGKSNPGLERQAAWAGLVFAALLFVSAVAHAGAEEADLWQDPPEPLEIITILGTNDLHGAVDPHLPDWAGAVRAIREGQKQRLGQRSNVLLVDAGDQFQGTLLSNFNEGKLVFGAYSAIGYDAVVPGNHDYDFGPEGWLFDKTGQGSSDLNPRGVIEKLARTAAFPLLSANTYLRESLREATGGPVAVTQKGCLPAQAGQAVAWSRAKRPAFLQPYVIRQAASAS
jgi:2',3'-cyclic-nucleotide 2'-phosphodiesterase (5'-nucleotidase family)